MLTTKMTGSVVEICFYSDRLQRRLGGLVLKHEQEEAVSRFLEGKDVFHVSFFMFHVSFETYLFFLPKSPTEILKLMLEIRHVSEMSDFTGASPRFLESRIGSGILVFRFHSNQLCKYTRRSQSMESMIGKSIDQSISIEKIS